MSGKLTDSATIAISMTIRRCASTAWNAKTSKDPSATIASKVSSTRMASVRSASSIGALTALPTWRSATLASKARCLTWTRSGADLASSRAKE